MSLLKKAISISSSSTAVPSTSIDAPAKTTSSKPATKPAPVSSSAASASAPALKPAGSVSAPALKSVSAHKPVAVALSEPATVVTVAKPAPLTSYASVPLSGSANIDISSPIDHDDEETQEEEHHANSSDESENQNSLEYDDAMEDDLRNIDVDAEAEADVDQDVDPDVFADSEDIDAQPITSDSNTIPPRPKRPSEQFCRLTDRMKRLQRYVMYVLCGADLPELAGRFSTEEIVRILKLAEPVKAQVKMLAPANPPTRHMPGAAELPMLPKVVKPVTIKHTKKRKNNLNHINNSSACKKHVLKFNPDEPVTNILQDDQLSLIHPDALSIQQHDVDICIVKPIRILDQHFLIDNDNLLYSHLGDDPRPIGKLVNKLPSLF